MFIGTVMCEVELTKAHPAFEDYRFLLVEPEHEVEWEGSVVAVDTVGAQVGDMVIVALAPLGSSFDLPADLPIDGATVGVVGTITTPAEDDEEEDEGEPERPVERERAPERDRERSGGRRDRGDGPGGRRDRPSHGSARREEPVEEERAETRPPRGAEEAPSGGGDRDQDRRGGRRRRRGPRDDDDARDTGRGSDRPASEPERETPKAREEVQDLEIVWDSGDPKAESGDDRTSVKRKAPRRRR